MKIGFIKSIIKDKRVPIVLESAKKLMNQGHQLFGEQGAGLFAGVLDSEYEELGVTMSSRTDVLEQSEVILTVDSIHLEEYATLAENKVVIGMFKPITNRDGSHAALKYKITVFSLKMLPRSSRAQSMDVLSSQATAAGYKAVLHAAFLLPRFFPMFMTAAGTIRPAKVLVLGAGVAGLQAVATARKLGAQVEAFDVRRAAGEEVRSLGAIFIEVKGANEDAASGGYAIEQSDDYKQKQMDLIQEHAIKADIVITTAKIPGGIAPILITKDTVGKMKRGSVIIDLASANGGNCEVVVDNQEIDYNGVKVVGNSNFPSELPEDASRMFGNNMVNFIGLLTSKENNLGINFDDEIIRETCVAHHGEVISTRLKKLLNIK